MFRQGERGKERESASSGKPKAADRVSSVTHKSRLNREQARGDTYVMSALRGRGDLKIILFIEKIINTDQ